MGLSIKFETVKSGRSILYNERFHKKCYISFSEDRVCLEYSVDPGEKSFVQYFLWVFTVCHVPRLPQIDLDILLRYNMQVLNDFNSFVTPAHFISK